MDDVSQGINAAASVVKAAPGWCESVLSLLDKYNYLSMSERRKKNMFDKAEIEQRLEVQRAEHLQLMEITAAQTKARIALLEGVPKLALEAAKKKIDEGIPVEQAYQACLPSAVRAANNLLIDTLEGDYSAERIGLYAVSCTSANPEEPIGEGQTSKTWEAAFWNYARGIRDEEAMQQWGRLLAEEIKQPGKISIRTLEILRSLSSRSAKNFRELSQYAFSSILVPWSDKNLPININAYDVGLLASSGLLMDDKVFTVNNKVLFTNRHFSVALTVTEKYSFSVLSLTDVGSELYSIVDVEKDASLAAANYLRSIFDSSPICSTEIFDIST